MKPEEAREGVWVVYTAYPGADSEDGTIVSVKALERGIVHVLYRGDTTPKATRLADLRLGRLR